MPRFDLTLPLQKLFAKWGDLKVCRFDRNEFGQFLGSATVTYENPKDAKTAIQEYNGAHLDDKVLTVEYDMITHVNKVPKESSGGQKEGATLTKKGPRVASAKKTLRVR